MSYEKTSRRRVLVSDPRKIVRAGLLRALQGAGEQDVLVVPLQDLVAPGRSHTADLVVVGGLPAGRLAPEECSGVSAGGWLQLVHRPDEEQARRALRRGITLLDTSVCSLPHVIAVVQGKPRPASAPLQPAALTPREAQVLRLLAAGATSQGVARDLGISVHTVHNHRENILSKLGVHSTPQALAVLASGDAGNGP